MVLSSSAGYLVDSDSAYFRQLVLFATLISITVPGLPILDPKQVGGKTCTGWPIRRVWTVRLHRQRCDAGT